MKIRAFLASLILLAPLCATPQAFAAGPNIDAGNQVVGCKYTSGGLTTFTTDTYVNLQCDSSGNLKVTGGGGGSSGAILSSGADGTSNSTSTQAVSSFNYVWNGTTWDRETGTAANGAYVTLKQGGSALSTSNTLPVSAGGHTAQVSYTPTITAGAYTAGKEVGGLLQFNNAFLAADSGVVQSIHIVVKSVQTTGFKLYLFRSNPSNTTWTDNTTPAINSGDLPFLIGVYALSSADSGLGTMTVYNLDGIGKYVQATTTSLYGVLVTTGTPTFASSSDVTVFETAGQD